VSAARAFEATSHIAASPAEVWPVLTDVAAWPTWDSGVVSVEGAFGLGGKLTVTVAANPGKAFPVTVKEIDEPNRMVFRGGMPLGLFVGERTYTLAAEQDGTRFTMREEYTGLMAGMIVKSIPDLSPSFHQFADGLAQRVQQLRST